MNWTNSNQLTHALLKRAPLADNVYIQAKKGETPYSVCTVLGFQSVNRHQSIAQCESIGFAVTSRAVVLQNSRNQVQVHVKHYYRATEVPDSVYLPLINDRNAETSECSSTLFPTNPKRPPCNNLCVCNHRIAVELLPDRHLSQPCV